MRASETTIFQKILNLLNRNGFRGIFMVKCPDCMKEYKEYKKKWKYGKFNVEAYSCECGTNLREYTLEGKHSFTLKKAKKDKRWKKP